MKINRLTARVMAVFAAVLLIAALSVPAFAATSYECIIEEFLPGNQRLAYPGFFPEGSYNLKCQLTEDSPLMDLGYVSVCYEVSEGYFLSQSECIIEEEGQQYSVTFLAFHTGSPSSSVYTNFGLSLDGESFLPYRIILESLDDEITPSLSNYITAETLPNVFNEIVSLLPIALGVIVGYIVIRKGISYLQSFLHNS